MSAQAEQLTVAALELHGNGKATPAIMKRVTDGIAEGLSIAQAAVEAEVHPATVYGWRRKGQETDQEPYVTFVRECMRAEARLAARCLATVFEAMRDENVTPTQLKAATWTLERRFPELWGSKLQVWSEQHVEVAQASGGQPDVANWSTPERITALLQIAKETGVLEHLAATEGEPSEPPATEVIVQRRHNPEQSGCDHVASNESRMRCGKCGVGVAYPLPEESAV